MANKKVDKPVNVQIPLMVDRETAERLKAVRKLGLNAQPILRQTLLNLIEKYEGQHLEISQ